MRTREKQIQNNTHWRQCW